MLVFTSTDTATTNNIHFITIVTTQYLDHTSQITIRLQGSILTPWVTLGNIIILFQGPHEYYCNGGIPTHKT